MARATLKLKRPITQFELDLDENSLEAISFIRMSEARTNADKLRAMSDEELAEFIGGNPMHDICPDDCFEDPDRSCKVCVLNWLKQEAKE